MKLREVFKDTQCRFTVAIEGPDRVGKQTQARLLAANMQGMGGFEKVGIIETPIKDKVTHPRIYEMLRDGRAVKYPATFQGLQILNRALYQDRGLKHWAETYDGFVFDRWNASSFAYGRAAGLSADEIMCELDLIASPDLTIVLEGDPFPKDDLDDYESDMSFQRRVRDGYIEWAESHSGQAVYIVDANDEVSAVEATIWSIVEESLRGLHGGHENVVDFMPFLERKRQENKKE